MNTRKIHQIIKEEYVNIMLQKRLDEAKSKKVTKQMWAKMSEYQRMDALLTVVKDPDKAEKFLDKKWNQLPSGFERDMYTEGLDEMYGQYFGGRTKRLPKRFTVKTKQTIDGTVYSPGDYALKKKRAGGGIYLNMDKGEMLGVDAMNISQLEEGKLTEYGGSEFSKITSLQNYLTIDLDKFEKGLKDSKHKAAYKKARKQFMRVVSDVAFDHHTLYEGKLNEISAMAGLADVMNGRTTSIEGVKMSKELARGISDWVNMSPFGRKYGKQIKKGRIHSLIGPANVMGIDRYLGSKGKQEWKALYAKHGPKRENMTEALARGLKPLLQAGTKITKNVGEDTLIKLSDKFDRIDDEGADDIASHLNMAIELMQDGEAGAATKMLKQFNKKCKEVLKGKSVGSVFEGVNTENNVREMIYSELFNKLNDGSIK